MIELRKWFNKCTDGKKHFNFIINLKIKNVVKVPVTLSCTSWNRSQTMFNIVVAEHFCRLPTDLTVGILLLYPRVPTADPYFRTCITHRSTDVVRWELL